MVDLFLRLYEQIIEPNQDLLYGFCLGFIWGKLLNDLRK